MKAPVLRISEVSKRFGGLQALSSVSLQICQGEIYGLIGPNGAGKTTLFNVITGLYPPDFGTFEMLGQPYRPKFVHEVTALGIARTFQNIRLFSAMTVLENVMVGANLKAKTGLLGTVLRTPAMKRNEENIREASLKILRYVGIENLASRIARTLSYGDQRRLEIARALATEPKLLALDEPAAGMNTTEKKTLRELIDRIRGDGRSILLIEHDVKLVMGLCDQITALDYGKVIAAGAPADVRRNPAFVQAYLGANHA